MHASGLARPSEVFDVVEHAEQAVDVAFDRGRGVLLDRREDAPCGVVAVGQRVPVRRGVGPLSDQVRDERVDGHVLFRGADDVP